METKTVKSKNTFENILKLYGKKYKNNTVNPEYFDISIFQIIYNCVGQLKANINNADDLEITWHKPLIELQYPLPDDLSSSFKELIKNIKEVNPENVNLDYPYTANIQKDSISYNKQFAGTALDENNETSNYTSNLSVEIDLAPTRISREKPYHSIRVSLKFKGNHPTNWSDKDKDNFWNTILDELLEVIKNKYPKRNLVLPEETFAFPSASISFSLLALFLPRSNRLPVKLLEKPKEHRTEEEQEKVENFVQSVLRKKDIGYGEERLYAIIDNPISNAQGEFRNTLFNEEELYSHDSLAMYIIKAYGIEGFKNYLGLLVGLEENNRKGYFQWSLNEHLSRLGYRREKSGSFNLELKKKASAIMLMFTNVFLITHRKNNKKAEEIVGQRLFSMDGFKIKKFDNRIIDEKIIIRATSFWYQNSFEGNDKFGPMYTKLLRSLVRENHYKHPYTIILSVLLSIWWRMKPTGYKITIRRLMDWCNLNVSGHRKFYYLRKLEKDLDYMKLRNYLGDWYHSEENEKQYPSEWKNKIPFDTVITLIPPIWLKNQLEEIKANKEIFLENIKTNKKLKKSRFTKENFIELQDKLELSDRKFAKKLGISHTMISLIKKGKRPISEKISQKIEATLSSTGNKMETKTYGYFV